MQNIPTQSTTYINSHLYIIYTNMQTTNSVTYWKDDTNAKIECDGVIITANTSL